jgi:hypothetical protein
MHIKIFFIQTKYPKFYLQKQIVFVLILALFCFTVKAQKAIKFYSTTSIGMLKPVSQFKAAYQNSLALNSGFEYAISPTYFGQFVLDYNAIKYNQQIKDANSEYLFQKTNSSVFLAGINFGRNFYFSKSKKVFFSGYLGLGYANIGEPRLSVDNRTTIITQNVTRMKGLFIRRGSRIAFKTNLKMVQTLYLDASYWTANTINIQNSKPKALSLLVGFRSGI